MLKAIIAQDLTQSTRFALASGLSLSVECLEVIQHMSIFAALSLRRKQQDIASTRYVFNGRRVVDPPPKKGDS